MRWFADNSELNGINAEHVPDILLFGGIAVSPENEKILQKTIEDVKKSFGCHRLPIKWNFKDLQKAYKDQKQEDIYRDLLCKSKNWREEIFRKVANIDFTIILACIEANSAKIKVLKNLKPELTRYVFNNGLMRYALHVKECKPVRAEVILDWPDKKDSSPFDIEYESAYSKGETYDHNEEYYSGPLENLNFLDMPVFANMNYSTLLQFADLIVGSTREFVECCIGKKPTGFGVEMLKLIKHRFRGASSNNIYGRGLSIASNCSTFQDKIKNGLKTII